MSKQNKNSVRIISGKWRKRMIYFPDQPELRPTPDRIRETLFNWLREDIEGSVCFDMFAGSGAIGFEALSRGAKKVVFFDKEPDIIKAINESAKELGVDRNNHEVIYGTFPEQMSGLPNLAYDIVFLDPPFKEGLINPCLNWLMKSGRLKSRALVYIESEREFVLSVSSDWEVIKEDHTKTMSYRLLRVK